MRKLVISMMIALIVGVFIGHYRSRRALTICKAQNIELARDLGNAINRGMTLETNLNLCKGNSK